MTTTSRHKLRFEVNGVDLTPATMPLDKLLDVLGFLERAVSAFAKSQGLKAEDPGIISLTDVFESSAVLEISIPASLLPPIQAVTKPSRAGGRRRFLGRFRILPL